MAGTATVDDQTERAEGTWEARPVAAALVRCVAIAVPLGAGAVASVVADRRLGTATTVTGAVLRALVVIAVSTAAVLAVDRAARRLLPLATLLNLSLVFPDQAPARFRTALKAGSSRRLAKLAESTRSDGLPDDPTAAAEQVLLLIRAIGDHDRRTRGHSERVRLFADMIGQELGLGRRDRQLLQWGALVHDLGKLTVPPEILNKRGRPDADEWKILQQHPKAGEELIAPLRPLLGEWADAVGGHHEKWDGSGYPRGLRGPEITRAAAIVAVADSFEVMTAIRSYKKAMSMRAAREELTRCAGTHFSPEVVRAFLSLSLGRLRLAMGPLSALAHLPFAGQVAQAPGVVTGASAALRAATTAPVVAGVTAGALVASLAAPSAVQGATIELASAESSPSGAHQVAGGTSPGGVGSADGAGGAVGDEGAALGEGASGADSDPTGHAGDGSGDSGAGGDGSSDATDGTTGGGGSGSGSSPGSGSGSGSGSGTGSGGDGRSGSDAGTGGDGSSTTPGHGDADGDTGSGSPSTGGPSGGGQQGGGSDPGLGITLPDQIGPITVPSLPLPLPTSSVPGGVQLTLIGDLPIWYSTKSNRSNPAPLAGATFDRGAKIYVFVTQPSLTGVQFWLGPSIIGVPFSTDLVAPFDLVPGLLGAAKAWTVPSTPGTHWVTGALAGSVPLRFGSAPFTVR